MRRARQGGREERGEGKEKRKRPEQDFRRSGQGSTAQGKIRRTPRRIKSQPPIEQAPSITLERIRRLSEGSAKPGGCHITAMDGKELLEAVPCKSVAVCEISLLLQPP